ncbi:CLUMA_CG010898, isoform A, partial [Clunio marinus]
LGTHFDEVAVGSLINVTIQDGKTAFLNCKINLLQDKTVSWVRRMYYYDSDDEPQRQELQLLTVGTNTFVADTRYSVDFQFPNNFRLMIQNVTKRDEGIYECQISTHPPKVIQYYLHVNAPELFIADESQKPLYERHYEVNSTLELYCYVHNIEMTSSVVLWIHNDHVLNYDAIRGGISVRTDLTEEGANSTLSVAKINKSDSGNYTCSIGPTHSFTTTVHVLNGK